MALIQCHECSAQISDHARTCPKCGAPVIATIKRRQKAFLIELGVRAVFAAIFITVALLWFHHAMRKVTSPEKEPIQELQEQQLQQQQRQMAVASQPVVMPVLTLPTQPPPPEPSWVNQIKLGGINGTSDHHFAVINGKTFEKADTAIVKIAGKSITIHCLDIGETSATISVDGVDGPITLNLN